MSRRSRWLAVCRPGSRAISRAVCRPGSRGVLVLAVVAMASGCSLFSRGDGSLETAPGSLPEAIDVDGDGVMDVSDACPDTLFITGVGEDGCSPFNGVIEGVDFAPGSVQLGSVARGALAPLIVALEEHPEVRIEVQGHTDNRGSAAENLELSKRRVMSVVRYLVTAGVAPERLDPIAFGESRPIEKNATAEGRAANRRIEVRAIAS